MPRNGINLCIKSRYVVYHHLKPYNEATTYFYSFQATYEVNFSTVDIQLNFSYGGLLQQSKQVCRLLLISKLALLSF